MKKFSYASFLLFTLILSCFFSQSTLKAAANDELADFEGNLRVIARSVEVLEVQFPFLMTVSKNARGASLDEVEKKIKRDLLQLSPDQIWERAAGWVTMNYNMLSDFAMHMKALEMI